MTCPYHQWPYDMNGALRTAPVMPKGRGHPVADFVDDGSRCHQLTKEPDKGG
ncbi:Rieske 2Fe-2S domain-containing protein [Streptosporangium sp. NPDC000095]|uniref:Rieske 2Fe-2S domain-containing protein n=1 Tax=Streptosporangium sp. NPDC000095 TaxID=3366184 RepID=UPI0036CBEF02